MKTNNDRSGDGERLPEDIYNKIMTYLPIRDAVGTSLLSRSWRYRWRSIPNLIFDRESFPVIDRERIMYGMHPKPKDHWNYRFVGHVLKLYDRRCIRTFEVTVQLFSYDVIEEWIRALATCSTLERFTVLAECEHFSLLSIPMELFSFQHLTSMELTGCVMRVPPDFDGFPLLTDLVMNNIYYVDRTEPGLMPLGTFLSSCTKLRRLQIHVQCLGYALEISLPNLCSLDFRFEHFFTYIRLNTPKLVYARLTLEHNESEFFGIDPALKDYTLTNLLANCPLIEELALYDHHKGVPIGYHKAVPRFLSYSFDHLKFLDLSLSIYIPYEVTLLTLCLLRSSPVLKHLRLCVKFYRILYPGGYENSFWEKPTDLCNHPDASFWEAQEAEGCICNNLEKLDFDRVEGSVDEMALIKFLLKNTPSLLEVNVRVAPKMASKVKLDDCQLKGLVQDLLKVKRDEVQGILRSESGSIIF